MTQNAINTAHSCLQFLYTSTNSVITCSTSTPTDDTIPQNTEGDEVITLSITPILATSKLLIVFNCAAQNTANVTQMNIALFQDTTANALSACSFRSNVKNGYLRYMMTSGTTSSTTFKIRIGKTPVGGTAWYVNGDSAGARVMGGVSQAFLTIKEISY